MEILVSIAFAASGLALLCYGGNWLGGWRNCNRQKIPN